MTQLEQVVQERRLLREALKRTAVALKRSEVDFCLCGGYAAWARGGPESEHDVDFLIAEDDVDRAIEVLREAGLEVERPPEDWLFKVWTDGVFVDVLFRLAGVPVSREMARQADELEVLSVRMPVLRATELFSSKLLALSEHFCNYSRLLPAARALREQVDWERVRAEVGQHPYADAFLYLLQRLEVVPPQAA
ncbi:nucleotidyltransferase family protein [Kineococcus glutinatus]|uniref:Nucleotidyltransferase-like protein n=1 Tax=Kineococcus glutinatus TaxID=1070872 RepID=A0ABP9I6N1_9ACTN